jgi:tripartite-type tricarboxylate transporter receptor subunit TctC
MQHARIPAAFAVGLAVVAACCGISQAQDYPTRPIRFIVPYTPGGTVDVIARALAQTMGDTWGQQIIVDNRPGAGGNLGTEAAAKSAPDGYTLLFSTSTPLTTNLALYKSIRYQTERDFDGVTLIGESAVFVVANPKLPVKSIADVIALAKAKPDTLSIGTSGHGTVGHFLTTRLNQIEGVKIAHVPHRGGVPAVTAVLAGDVQLAIVDTTAALPLIREGQVRAIGVSSKKRSSSINTVPSLAESGVPNLEMVVWVAFMAPKGTPQPILAKLNAEVQKNLKDAKFLSLLARLGVEPVENVGLAKFNAFISQEIPRWRQIVKESGMKLQ